MLSLVPGPPTSPVFLLPDNTNFNFPLTMRVLVSSFRNALELAGVPDSLSFRGHSFRRGAATWAFRIGIPGEIIQLYDGWFN